MPYLHDLDRLVQIANRSRVFFDIWWVLESRDTRPKYIKTMRKYQEFFRFEPLAHQIACVLHLAQLFETNASTRNLHTLLGQAEAEGVAREVLDAARGSYQRSNGLRAKIAILRSNVFAHSAAKVGFDEAFELAEITADQLRELTEIALEVVNHLLRAAGKTEFWYDTASADDATRLLETLQSVS